jgi:hypothetical protein
LIQKSTSRDSIVSNSNSTASLRRLFQQYRPTSDIGQIEIPQRSSAVLSFPPQAREHGCEAARLHHAARRRGGGVAARGGAGAAVHNNRTTEWPSPNYGSTATVFALHYLVVQELGALVFCRVVAPVNAEKITTR